MTENTVDIVIPVFNEGPNICRVLKSLCDDVKTPFRVMICYDMEEDNTLPAVRAMSSSHDINVVFVKNHSRGPHSAVLAGFRVCTAPAVLVLPADDDYNSARLDDLIGLVLDGTDIACASRFLSGGGMEGCPWLKAFLVRSAAFSMYYIARIPTRDATNGLRCFSRRVIDTVLIESTEGFTFSIELLVKVHRLGWPIKEAPVKWFERREGQGESRFKLLKWLPAYLRWYFYAFATTYGLRGAQSVTLKS